MPLLDEILDHLAEAREVLIETSDDDRTARTVIWVVSAEGDLYIRSYRGETGAWYQRALANPRVALIVDDLRAEFEAEPVTDSRSVELASEGFRQKYPNSGSLDAMLVPEVLNTTMRLVPV